VVRILLFALPEIPEDHMVAGIRVTLSAQAASTVTIITEAETACGTETRKSVANYAAGTGSYVLDTVNNSDISSICVYASWAPQTVNIESLELLLLPCRDVLENNLQELQKNNIQAEKLNKNTFLFTVTDAPENGMLVLPLIYSQKWCAEVDGKPVKVYNVNGGLVGIPLNSGDTVVNIAYSENFYPVGICLTVVGVLILLLSIKMINNHQLPNLREKRKK